jgi:hypothetical protein
MTQVGEMDKNGYIAFIDVDYEEHSEWLEKEEVGRSLEEKNIIWALLERGATPKQTLKALEEIKNNSIDQKECFNNIVKEKHNL